MPVKKESFSHAA